MNKWLKRIRGGVGMGLTWALAWAIGGLLIGVSSILLPGLPWDAFFEVFDAPLPALAIPGFFAGVFFSTVLGVAARRRRFSGLSLPAFAAWGALGGVLVTLLPFALVAVGLASREGSTVSTWQILTVITMPFVLFGAASATATLVLARIAEKRESRATDDDIADADFGDGATRELSSGATTSVAGRPAPWPGARVRPDPVSRSGDT